jgi:hypothetical protein
MIRAGDLKDRLEKEEYEDLIWGLSKGDCVLFLGPGLDVTLTDGTRTNLARRLANRLAESIEGGVSANAALGDVAQRYMKTHAAPGRLQRQVEQFYQEHQVAADDPVFTSLARLPFRLVVTTRHDATLVKHMEAQGKSPVVRAFDIDRVDHGTFEGSVESPLVYHLFGEAGGTGPVILTEGDIHRMLAQAGSELSPLPKGLQSELKDKMLLLGGFGVGRWHTRLLLSDLGVHKGKYQSFALDEFDAFTRATVEEAARFFLGAFRVETVVARAEEIVRKLADLWDMEGGDVVDPEPARERIVLENAPKVFLSYRHEDDEAAKSVYRAMERAGLKPFRDKEGLEGGDDWDAVLKTEVKHADYFVLLYSSGLAEARKSFVRAEVDLALEVQRQLKEGEKFIIPFLLDEGLELPPKLEGIQGVPATTPDEISTQVVKIARDFQRWHC